MRLDGLSFVSTMPESPDREDVESSEEYSGIKGTTTRLGKSMFL